MTTSEFPVYWTRNRKLGGFLKKGFQLISVEKMIKSEYHHFAIPNDIIYLGNDYQCLLKQVKS